MACILSLSSLPLHSFGFLCTPLPHVRMVGPGPKALGVGGVWLFGAISSCPFGSGALLALAEGIALPLLVSPGASGGL